MPRRSHGVLSTPIAGQVVVYDLLNETRHQLNAAAGIVLDCCDGVTDRREVVEGWAKDNGVEPTLLASQIDAALTRFRDLGLVDRDMAWQEPTPRTGLKPTPSAEVVHGRSHLVLDRVIRFRGTDAELIAQIDDYLGTGVHGSTTDRERSRADADVEVFEVIVRADGSIELWTDEEVWHDTVGTLLRRLVAETTDYAVATHGCAALHAGGVRAADGRVVVLPSVPEGGKSTLTAAFVKSGWDYLGDEAIGITMDGIGFGFPKRLRLDPTSRSLLGLGHSPDRNVDPAEIRPDVRRFGGRVGPIDLVVFPTFEPGATVRIEPLDVHDALDALLANTHNMACVGQPGLDALCTLAESTPAYRLVHGDAFEAIPAIVRLLDADPTDTSSTGI